MGECEKILIEIPIYSMKEQEFHKRWDKYKNSIRINTSQTDAELNQMINDIYYPQNEWKYNQIIGYVTISAGINDIIINEYRTLDKRFYAVSKTKHWIQDLYINGSGIYVGTKNNDEIIDEIKKRLESLNHEYKKYFIDYSALNNIIKYIDFRKIIYDIGNDIEKRIT